MALIPRAVAASATTAATGAQEKFSPNQIHGIKVLEAYREIFNPQKKEKTVTNQVVLFYPNKFRLVPAEKAKPTATLFEDLITILGTKEKQKEKFSVCIFDDAAEYLPRKTKFSIEAVQPIHQQTSHIEEESQETFFHLQDYEEEYEDIEEFDCASKHPRQSKRKFAEKSGKDFERVKKILAAKFNRDLN